MSAVAIVVITCDGCGAQAVYAEQGAARRRDLTADQVAELGDITDMQGWADRARALVPELHGQSTGGGDPVAGSPRGTRFRGGEACMRALPAPNC